MFPALALLSIAGGSPIVTFVIISVLVAVGMYFLPRVLPLDAQIWMIIRVVVIIALILWALQLFGIM